MAHDQTRLEAVKGYFVVEMRNQKIRYLIDNHRLSTYGETRIRTLGQIAG
jgi:hypothetical protein